jgi:hypothetical protein
MASPGAIERLSSQRAASVTTVPHTAPVGGRGMRRMRTDFMRTQTMQGELAGAQVGYWSLPSSSLPLSVRARQSIRRFIKRLLKTADPSRANGSAF